MASIDSSSSGSSGGSTSSSQQDNQHVFVLTLESIEYGNEDFPARTTIGVYSCKAAAVAASENVEVFFGTFDSAIRDIFKKAHEDNRGNPPDDGVLIQLGHRDLDEGDIERLTIQKFPILGVSSFPHVSRNKGKRMHEETRCPNDDAGRHTARRVSQKVVSSSDDGGDDEDNDSDIADKSY